MILGRVNTRLDAKVDVSVIGVNGQVHPITALVDTGFNGELTLRPADIASLGLRLIGAIRIQLADGSVSYRKYFAGQIQWASVLRTIDVLELETDTLLGMQMLSGSRLTIDVVPGATVSIGSIP